MAHDSITARIMRAFDSSISETEREPLLREVAPYLRAQARKISRDPHEVEDLLSHLHQQLLNKKFDSDRGPNPAWICTVLRNHRCDLRTSRRLASADAQAGADRPDPAAPLDRANAEAHVDRTTPFPLEDLVAFRDRETWAPRDLFLVLVYYEQFGRLTKADQRSILRAVKPRKRYSPEQLRGYSAAELKVYLKDALGVTDANFRQILHRCVPRLKNCRFVQDLLRASRPE